MTSSMDLEAQYCAHNYHPLPVLLTRGEGVFVWDDEGNKYLDMMSAYSAASHGHTNRRLVNVAQEQLARLTIYATARSVCEALLQRGLLSKETHETVVRLAPPLIIGKAELDWAITQIRSVLDELKKFGSLHEFIAQEPLNA